VANIIALPTATHSHVGSTQAPIVCEGCAARPQSVCQGLEPNQLRRLAGCGGAVSYPSGATLVRQGEPAAFVFNINEGALMLFRMLSDGRRQVLGFLIQGDFLGLTAGATYDFGAQALTPVQVCRFPRQAFRRFLLQAPMLERELLARASDELLAARAHLTLLGRRTAMERVCSFLLNVAERQARQGRTADSIDLPMTRSDIGDYLGLTPETVSRSLSVLRRLKAIQPKPEGLLLLKPSLLRELADAA
jgi:CRP/FNR family transcriptional regulator